MRERSTVRRLPKRAHYDEETIHGILDAAPICHVAFTVEGQPFVIPTIHARVGDVIYLHGAVASRMLKVIALGAPVCLAATLLDGLVIARSWFHHSMNYRSVVVFGRARAVVDRDERMRALTAIVEHVVRGRAEEARAPNEKELGATAVVALPIDEASAKVRTGGPIDDEEDYALDVWAGVVPLVLAPREPIADDRLRKGIAPSASVRALGTR